MILSAGGKLGPYEILSPLGAGGMGEVWKARDTRLDRIVAIKQLKGGPNKRFKREARAIAALNHPNICQIHDVGPNYLVLEYIEGKPVRGPMPIEDALRLAVQIIEALAEAHRKGIIHRDLKPGNVLVTKYGSAKLLDFGLAKLILPAADGTTATITAVAGTPAYMSPEQASGKFLDERSDIFSFGALMYEMLSGNRAFRGASAAEAVSAILRDDPEPLNAPGALIEIVKRCLRKSPGERFQTAVEIKAALESISVKHAEDQPTVAVLPFVNMSRDPDDEYFSDGLADEILNALSQIAGLRVTARTSSFAFRGKEDDIRKIAGALGVRTILEGSVRRAGNRFRVTAQLVNAKDGYRLWSERYDRELRDVFAMQDEIAGAVALALRGELIGKPARARLHEPTPPAYEAYLKGRHQFSKRSPEGFARAKEYLEQAIALDPKWPEPHSMLGNLHFYMGGLGLRPLGEMVALARVEARSALELLPSEPSLTFAIGGIRNR
jgi:TolB-like protein/predicted Ser/Thr protein kinase